MNFAKIRCPVDFSEFSVKAMDCAYSLALHYDSRLFVQHVIEPATVSAESPILPDIVEMAYSQKVISVEAQIRAVSHLWQIVAEGIP